MTFRDTFPFSLGTALSCCLALVSITGCSRQANLAPETPVKVIIQAASLSAKAPTRWAGIVRSHQQARLSFTLAGRVQALHAEVGDEVETGTVLAELDPEPFQLALRQAEAELLGAKPQLEELTRRRDSEERLWAQQATSRSDYDATLSAYAAASARVLSAESAVALATRQLRETRLLAPCPGRVAQRLCQASSWVEAGAPAFDFDPHGEPEVVLALPASALVPLGVGSTVMVFTGEPGAGSQALPGKLANISRRGQAGGVHEVLVKLPQNAGVQPGQTVFAELQEYAGAARALLVPITALVPGAQPNRGHVFVFDKSLGGVRQREVVYGQPVDQRVVIEQGLQPNEFLVVAGAAFLRDDQKVSAQIRK